MPAFIGRRLFPLPHRAAPNGAEGSAGAKLKASVQRRCACVFMLRQDE